MWFAATHKLYSELSEPHLAADSRGKDVEECEGTAANAARVQATLGDAFGDDQQDTSDGQDVRMQVGSFDKHPLHGPPRKKLMGSKGSWATGCPSKLRGSGAKGLGGGGEAGLLAGQRSAMQPPLTCC